MADPTEQRKIELTSILTYSGAIPFVLAALCMYWDFERLPFIGDVQKIIHLYGLVIVVFIAGSHWGLSVNLLDKQRVFLLSISNFLTLAIFVSYIWLNSMPFELSLIAILLMLLMIDYWLFFKKINSQDYVLMRLIVSIIVIISLSFVYSS
jgi:hypothetical protein|tara:strand:+ start:6705 stop:7157 length:453 start_codon:yes stop_codon:yes gene_type:complete